jgi:hypothetical protein
MAERMEEVKTKILNAFAATPHPGERNLVADQSGWDPECRELGRDFDGKNWRDVTAELVFAHSQGLPLFTPVAYRHYLPAYLMVSLERGEAADTVRDFVVSNLTPPPRPTGWRADFFRMRATQFSAAEREAIRSFLELMEERRHAEWSSQGVEPPTSGIKAAIDYWSSES